MGFFGKLWARLRGMFITSGNDAVSSSPEAIRAAYASAIDEAKRRYKELEKVVALLGNEREKTEMIVKELEKRRSDLERKLYGTLSAAESDPKNAIHREEGTRYIALIEELDRKDSKLKEDLEYQQRKVDEYKVRLASSTGEIEKLRREQGEMMAEFVSSRQVLLLEDRLRGLSENATDESLSAIREKVAAMRGHAQVAAELRGATLESQDEFYTQIGERKLAAARFDELLKKRHVAKIEDPAKDRDLG